MEDVEVNTIKRKTSTAENPKRQSSTHHDGELNRIAKATPMKMKNNQKIQQKNERATVLLKLKSGSRLKTILLTT